MIELEERADAPAGPGVFQTPPEETRTVADDALKVVIRI